nr:MAG TPA: hypothetical protein [Caudoviricetes sp.]
MNWIKVELGIKSGGYSHHYSHHLSPKKTKNNGISERMFHKISLG